MVESAQNQIYLQVGIVCKYWLKQFQKFLADKMDIAFYFIYIKIALCLFVICYIFSLCVMEVNMQGPQKSQLSSKFSHPCIIRCRDCPHIQRVVTIKVWD